MTSISTIKTYLYCPRKLYIEENIVKDETKIPPLFNELKILKIDIDDQLNKNIRRIRKDMSISEIEETLRKMIPETIKNTFDSVMVSETTLSDDKISELYDDFNNRIYFNIKLLSIKTKKAMILLNKEGREISDMFFPTSIHSHYIKDDKINLTGICDKIEIIDGIYYPITFKNSSPPIKGVWSQDAIELAAQSILIEREFDCDVFVGFVEYQKISERRPVVMDVNIRKDVFNIIHEIDQLKMQKKAPMVKINENKCDLCEYNEICLEN